MKNSSLMVAAFALLFSAEVLAARYVIVYKNEQNFNDAHSQWVLGSNQKVGRLFSQRNPIQVEQSLEQVNALVVSSQNESLVRSLNETSEVIVEKEMFHRAPAPVKDHGLTQAWSFNANYAVSSEILKKKKKQPKQPETVNDGAEVEATDRTPWGIKTVKARAAWDMSHAGQGARVLVLDTGVDKDHPALKNQIEATKDFVGDHQLPYDVADKVGHGTHVAGTVLAEEAADGFVGVAPKAKLLAGRVCSEEGCSNIDVAAGINWGIEQKVDVINLSLGSDWGSQVEAVAVAKAEKAGVVVVAASGNDGKASVGYPAAYPTVLAVGATNVKNEKANFSQWGPELDVVAPGVEVMSSVPMGTGCASEASVTDAEGIASEVKSSCFSGSAFLSQGLKKEMVFVGLGKPEDFTGKNLRGKFALISRGEILFVEKVQNALAANADGVIIFNNVPDELMSGAVTEDGSVLAIPIVMIQKAVGEQLKADLAAGKSPQLEVKTSRTDYSGYSGTSMASPHAAGVAALVRATRQSLTPAQVREVLKTTTTVIGQSTQNEFGTGLIDAEKAVTKAYNLR